MIPKKGEALTGATVKASGVMTELNGTEIVVNFTPIESQIQALLQSGARGVMVAPSYDGQGLSAKAVTQGQSILNLATELKDHLTASPRSTEWIADLRDFLDQWLAARSEAGRTGGIAIPGPKSHYVLHVQSPSPEA